MMLSDQIIPATASNLSLTGRYMRSNLNMPHSLPQRSGGFRDYEKDAPITVLGCTQARLVGKSCSALPRKQQQAQSREKTESGALN